VVDALDQDGLGGRVEQREQPVVSDPKFALVRSGEGKKVALRIVRGGFQLSKDSACDRGVEPAQITRRSL